MASEIRVNQITSRTGVSTVSFTDSGPVISGVTTVQGSFNVTDGITGNVTGDVTANQITVGDTFLNATAIGIGSTSTAGRNAGISTALGTIIYNATSNSFEGYGPEGWSQIKKLVNTGLTATGGLIADYEDGGILYRAHIFKSSQDFVVSSLGAFENTVDYLVVAGGGSGGGELSGYAGGGGGAGGFKTGNSIPVSTSTYTVTVGAGGAGSVGPSNPGNNGTNTTIAFSSPVSVTGGGGGGWLAGEWR